MCSLHRCSLSPTLTYDTVLLHYFIHLTGETGSAKRKARRSRKGGGADDLLQRFR